MRAIIWAVLLIACISGVAAAATFYYYDEDPQYYWFWDGPPAFEVLVPAKPSFYVETEWAGHSITQFFFGETGPVILIGTMAGTDTSKAWEAVSGMWAGLSASSRNVSNSTITTDQGLQARFRVLESGTNPNGMVRMVAFTHEGRTAYLAFIGNQSDYTGNVQQYWLRAVHSFNWRP